jgi:hypothetical protein
MAAGWVVEEAGGMFILSLPVWAASLLIGRVELASLVHRAADVDGRADQYPLGVLAYELLRAAAVRGRLGRGA